MGVGDVRPAGRESARVPLMTNCVTVAPRGPSLPRCARKSGQDRRAVTRPTLLREELGMSKKTLSLVGSAGLLALAACSGPTGPEYSCSLDETANVTVCSPIEAQQASDLQ